MKRIGIFDIFRRTKEQSIQISHDTGLKLERWLASIGGLAHLTFRVAFRCDGTCGFDEIFMWGQKPRAFCLIARQQLMAAKTIRCEMAAGYEPYTRQK